MTIFAYAGQGSQYVGMGMDIYDKYEEYRNVYDSIDDCDSIKKLIADGPDDELTLTKNTQPAYALYAAGVTEVLKAHGIYPDGTCGLSLGEYGALYAAGVIGMNDYVNTVSIRGNAMQEAAEGLECAMSAVMGLDANTVADAVKKVDNGYVTVANYNCPGQCVICGDEISVQAAEELLKTAGAKRCIRLKVSGPFHTKYMEPAAETLSDHLSNILLNEAVVPVAMNVTGQLLDGKDDIRTLLKRQVCSSVRFEDDIKRFLEMGADTFIEIGPGKVLSGFIKKTAAALNKEVVVYTVDKAEDIEKLIEDMAVTKQ